MRKKRKILSIIFFVTLGIMVGVLLTVNLDWTSKGFASKTPVIGSQAPLSPELAQMQNFSKAFVAVSKEVLPVVVSISTSKIVKQSPREELFPPLFREFFKDFQFPEPESQPLQGLGSGVIVSEDGYILTNNHVIKNADDIKITLYDKRRFEAKLVGADPLTDVAVVKIEGHNLPVARLGNSDEVEIGEWVLAVGNPLYLYSTVTAGIVSAKGRAIGILQSQEEERNEPSQGSYAIENFIQTDAAINPGNSGGALVNLKAEVIGINTAIATQTGGYMGYGFAIPINLAKKIMADLIEKGYVTRAWLGIAMRNVDDLVAQRYGMDHPTGVIIEKVMEDSPAEKAHLKPLDIILKIDGKEMNSSNEVQSAIALRKPGEVVTLSILRDGKPMKIQVKLGQRETGKTKEAETLTEEGVPKLGLSVKTLIPELKAQYNAYEDQEGVLVTAVEPNSAGYDAGIRKGDLITQIEDIPIRSVSDYKKAIRSFPKGKVIIFHIQRGEDKFHAFVKLPK